MTGEAYMDYEPDEEVRDRDGETLPLLNLDDFYDLLMEQQEQM